MQTNFLPYSFSKKKKTFLTDSDMSDEIQPVV